MKDPKDYRWCGYAEALSGNRRAQRAMSKVTAKPVDGWESAGGAEAYRKLLFSHAVEVQNSDKTEVVRLGVGADQARAVLEAKGKLTAQELVQFRVRYFSDGLVIGGKEFVESIFGQHREKFGPKRKDGARRIAEALASCLPCEGCGCGRWSDSLGQARFYRKPWFRVFTSLAGKIGMPHRLSAARRPCAAWIMGSNLAAMAGLMPLTRSMSSGLENGRAAMMALARAGPIPGNESSSPADPKLISTRSGEPASLVGRWWTGASWSTHVPAAMSVIKARACHPHGTCCGSTAITSKAFRLRRERDSMTGR